jgi:hypothetical protein
MTSRVQEIRDASAQLDALNKRIDKTLRGRDRGPAERERWSNACEEFHRRYSELFYPGGDAALYALKRNETSAIGTALDFLEADPLHFRSGYTKEVVELASADDQPNTTRASYLLHYRDGASAGEEFRKKLRMERLMKWYRDKQSRI